MYYLKLLSGLIIIVNFSLSESQSVNILNAMKYRDFSCASKDDCDLGDDFQSKLSESNCPCDARCSMYGDCCSESISTELSPNSCLPKDGSSFPGVQTISQCPRRFKGLEEYKLRCENPPSDINDPAVLAPVTDPITGTTYRNSFCARCHREKVSNFVMWDAVFMCRSLDAESPHEAHSLEYLRQYKFWAIFHQKYWHHCELHFELPKDFDESAIKHCRRGIVDGCLPEWRDSQVENLCTSSTGMVYVGMQAYRNKYCAECNNIPSDRLSCNPQTNEENRNKFLTIRVDMNGDEGWEEPCDSSERYDFFFDRCRNIDEAVRGYALIMKG